MEDSKKTITNNFTHQQHLLCGQTYILYSGIPNSVAANVLGSIIALIIFWNHVDTTHLLSWVSLLAIVTLARAMNYRNFILSKPDPGNIDKWFTQFRLGSMLMALAVGSGGWLLFLENNSNYQVLLAFMLVCIAAFAITTMSPKRDIVVPFLIIMFLPILVALQQSSADISIYIFWMMFALLGLLIISASRISNMIGSNIQLTIEAEQNEKVIEKSQQRMSLYVKETPLAVIEWNNDFEVIEWNPAAEKIFGYSEDEARGQHADNLIVPPGVREHVSDIWLNLVNKTGGNRSINENITKDGKIILCEWFNTPLIDESGQVIGVTSLAQDITQRLENERLKNEFVSIVSHELRTPVTSIKGSLGLVAKGVLDDQPQKMKELIGIALSNTERLNLLINDILDVDKLESGKLQYHFAEMDIEKLIHDVVTENQGFSSQYNISLDADNLEHDVIVRIDADRIFQVLNNLVSNAIKFSPQGGVVHISTKYHDGRIRVSVSDQGEGIPEEDKELLFKKFSQRDASDTRAKGGSGLGLYISRQLLQQHNSDLDFVSRPGQGTTFYFDLDITNNQ